MKKLLLSFVLITTLILIGCGPETLDVDVITPDPEPAPSLYTLSLNEEISYEDGTVKIPISVTVEPSTEDDLGIRLRQNNIDVSGGIRSLNLSQGRYTRDSNNFGVSMDHASNGPLELILVTRPVGQSQWINTSESTTVEIQWPDDMDPIDDESEFKTVRFTEIERVNILNSDPKFRFKFTDNTFIGSVVTIELWSGGVFQNIAFERTLIVTGTDGQPGEIITDGISGLIEGNNYQWIFKNKLGQNPILKFLDINNDISETHVIQFAATASPVSAVATSNIQFTDITPTSFNSSLEINVESDRPATLRVRLYDAVGAGGNFISGTEKTLQTNPANQTETFIATFSEKTAATSYDVRYFLNDETTAFFSGIVMTKPPGSSDTEIESTFTDVNAIFAIIENDNSTRNDINAEVRFTGVDYEGNPRIEIEKVVFFDGNDDTDIPISKAGFKQNSSVLIEVIVNGAIVASATDQTKENIYGSYVFGNTTGNSISLASSQSNTHVGNVNFTSEGFSHIPLIHLKHSFPTGLDVNSYNDNVRINDSQTVDVTWTQTSPGIWETDFVHTIDIIPGMNNFQVALGNESYTPSGGSGTMDTGVLTVTLTDDNSFVIGQNSLGITINYLE